MHFGRILYTALAISLGLSAAFTLTVYAHKSTPIEVPVPTVAEKPKSILFVSDKSGNYEIYRMNLTTKETTNLTNNTAADMNPQLSPDGRFMVYYSNLDGDTEIYKTDLLLGQTTQLTDNFTGDYDPSFSPDGKNIVFKSTRYDKYGDIFIMKSDGTEQTNLTISRPTTEEWDPGFTADGKSILFISRMDGTHMSDELFIMQADGTEIKRLTNNDVPDWYISANNVMNLLLFISKTDQKNPDDIYTSLIDGTDRVQLTSLPGNDADPSWNATGDKIIFINDSDGDYDLYMMDADGANIEKIEDNNSDELSPIFLP